MHTTFDPIPCKCCASGELAVPSLYHEAVQRAVVRTAARRAGEVPTQNQSRTIGSRHTRASAHRPAGVQAHALRAAGSGGIGGGLRRRAGDACRVRGRFRGCLPRRGPQAPWNAHGRRLPALRLD